jgi:autotransporter-associated beta strand protein
MSNLITDKLITPCGKLTNPTLGGYIDAAGNIQGSFSFIPNRVIDIAGNMGAIPIPNSRCNIDAPIIGSSLPPGPWEMQLGTTETSRANYGIITSNFPANAASPTLSSFVSANCVGYMDGVISGTGTFTIKSGPETIGGVNYNGSGLLVLRGANTHTGNITMQEGTRLQLGENCGNTTTWAKGSLTIGANAIATQYASMPSATVVAENLNNSGIYNLIGCGDVCGVGGTYSTIGVTNNGTINLKGVWWRNSGIWSGTGIVNVHDGATLGLSSQAPSAGTTININGCGWCNASGVEQGALQVVSTGVFYTMKIKVQSESCIKLNSGVTANFTGILSGSAPLTVSGLGAFNTSLLHFTNASNTYHGTLTVDGQRLIADYYNSLQYADVVLVNGGRMQTSANTYQAVGSLASADPTTQWLSGDPTNNIIKANGVTTYAGKLLWTGGLYAANWFLEGGSENVLTMTGTGNTGNVYVRNGAKLILQGATFTGAAGQIRVQSGSTVSAGTTTTGSAVLIYLDATSALDVRAVGASTGIINTGIGTNSLSAGWKVNLLDPLPAGTHVIWRNTGAAITQLPVIGENLSGRTVTGFAWNNAVSPKTLSVTLI